MSEGRRFHFNPENGNTGKCDANIRCPFGLPLDKHYWTENEARMGYELYRRANGDSAVGKPRKRILRKFFAAGGALVAVYSLSNGGSSIAMPSVAVANPLSGVASTWWGGESEEVPQPVYEVDAYAGKEEQKQRENAAKVDAAKQKARLFEQKAAEIAKQKAAQAQEAARNRQVPHVPNEVKEDTKSFLKKIGQTGLDGIKKGVDGFRSNTGATRAADGTVLWQGKPIKPSANEVSLAKQNLEALMVKSESNVTYNRASQYGGWGSGTQGKVEHRDAPNGVFKSASSTSRAIGGSYVDPYSGKKLTLGPNATNIDHVVALSEAQQSGASDWSQAKRVQLANDLDNLVLSSPSENKSKSDLDAAEWKPSYKVAECNLAVTQIKVKAKYGLSVDGAEKAALQSVLNSRC